MQFHKKTSGGKYSLIIRLLVKATLLFLLVFVAIVLIDKIIEKETQMTIAEIVNRKSEIFLKEH